MGIPALLNTDDFVNLKLCRAYNVITSDNFVPFKRSYELAQKSYVENVEKVHSPPKISKFAVFRYIYDIRTEKYKATYYGKAKIAQNTI